MQELYPMTFEPVLKDYIWGGRNLEALGRTLPQAGVVAESWEIAGHPDGNTVVNSGPYAGKRLTEVQAELGLDLIGRRNAWAYERGKFPLLVKLLDANRPLSVQVHPDDAYALAHEGNELGKSEMWVVLAAKEGACVILGVKEGTTSEAFREAIAEGTLESHLHRVPVKAGDCVCVPSTSLHAVMEGVLIAEIQQNSNTTYRVYDWNRVGSDGQPRPLHIDHALDVINFEQVEPGLCTPVVVSEQDGVKRSRLCHNRYFVTERVEMAAGAIYHGECNGETLEIWGALEGQAEINAIRLDAVRFTLLPAAMGQFTVKALTKATLLRTYVE